MSNKKSRVDTNCENNEANDNDDDDNASEPTPISSLSSSSWTTVPLLSTGKISHDRVFGARSLLELIMTFIDRSADFNCHHVCRHFRGIISKSSIIEPPILKHEDFKYFRNTKSVRLYTNDDTVNNVLKPIDHRPLAISELMKIKTIVFTSYLDWIGMYFRWIRPMIKGIKNGINGQLENIEVDVIHFTRQRNDLIHSPISPFTMHNALVDFFLGENECSLLKMNNKPMTLSHVDFDDDKISVYGSGSCQFHSAQVNPDHYCDKYPYRYICTMGRFNTEKTYESCWNDICGGGLYQYWLSTGSVVYRCASHSQQQQQQQQQQSIVAATPPVTI